MKRKIRSLFLAVLMASAGVLLVSGPAQAATITAITTGGLWTQIASWDLNRVANSGDAVVIPSGKGIKAGGSDAYGTLTNNGTVTLKTAGTFIGGSVTNAGLIIAQGNFTNTGISNSGSIVANGTSLNPLNFITNGAITNYSTGVITVNGGVFQSTGLSNSGNFTVTNNLATAAVTINGSVQNNSGGTINISGGNFTTTGLNNNGGIYLSGSGYLYDKVSAILGNGIPSAFMWQSGGIFRVDGNVQQNTSYTLSGGTLDINNGWVVGGGSFAQSGTGSVTIDNGNFSVSAANYTKSGTGTFTGNNGSLMISQGRSLSGAGIFTSTGSGYTLNNSGKVTANGGTLDFSGFTGIANLSENTSTNGWYATNAGKLVLPSINVTGDGTYNWGEASGDATIDMVNSIQLAFNGVTTGGNFSISLLAADNPDVPEVKGPDAKVAAVFDFDPPAGFAFTDVDLAFRYDDAALALLGIPEASLKIYHNENGVWSNVTSSVDTVNKIIYASGITSFSDFAAGSGFATPEPATVVSGLIGLLGLAGRRLIRRKRKI